MPLSKDFSRDYRIALSSLLSNQVKFNLTRLSKKEITCIKVQFKDSNEIEREIGLTFRCLSANNGEFYYPPLSFNSPILTLSYWRGSECVIKEDLFAQVWKLMLENITMNQISGWIAVKSKQFVVRPPTLLINNEYAPYKISVGSSRPDVNDAFNIFNIQGFSINIMLGKQLRPDSNISIKLAYGEGERDIFYNQTFYIESWQKALHSCHLESNLNGKLSCNLATKNSEEKICIIMPIYNGIDETYQAINSLRQYFNSKGFLKIRILLGLDNPNNNEMTRMVHENFGRVENIKIIANETNLGFVGNCNNLYSMVYEDEDILLLNSDILCPSNDWISILLDYKNIDLSIGTVTPLSNQASIFSFPIPNKAIQTLPLGLNIDDINQILLLKNSQPEIIEVPSCHGFCVLIVNSRLKLSYLFDNCFGAGYGEENDLSLRLFKQGLKNICCPEVYIYHLESVSFSESKTDLLKNNLKLINEKHTGYDNAVAQYCHFDPLRSIRSSAIVNGLKLNHYRYNKGYILHICHDRGGGTHEFISQFIQSHPSVDHLLISPTKDKYLIQFSTLTVIEGDLTKDPIAYFYESELAETIVNNLGDGQIERVVFHSLIDFGVNIYSSSFVELAKKFQSTLYIHDYHWISPLENLLVGDYKYYGPHINNSLVDIEILKKNNFKPSFSESSSSYLMHSSIFINDINECVAPSKAAAKIFTQKISLKRYNHLKIEYHDHTHLLPSKSTKINKSDYIKIGVIGAIGPNKGSSLLQNICSFISNNNYNIKIIFIGNTCADEKFKRYPCALIHGRYKNENFPFIAQQYCLDGTLFVSPWPETFSYTLSLAFENNLFPFVLDSGAPAERVRKSQQGVVLTSSKPDYICRKIIDQFK